MAGPACWAAASPVSTNMPVPMIPPMPKAISDGMPSARFRLLSRGLLLIVADRLGGQHPFYIHVAPNVGFSAPTLTAFRWC